MSRWRAIFGVNNLDGFAAADTMPWPYSTIDLKRFKSLTINCTVVMGRGTWESPMPTPLPKRKNVILSRTLPDSDDGTYTVCRTVESLQQQVARDPVVWVIGGAQILWTLRSLIDEIHLSKFYVSLRSDVTIDTNKYLEDYTLQHKEWHDDHVYRVYRRDT